MAKEPTVDVVSSSDPISAAAEVLLAGGVVVLPTDTVYGIAALASLPTATARLSEIKGRTGDVPIAVLCADPAQALSLAGTVTPDVKRLTERLWPGPLTLVLPRRRGIDLALGEPSTTIGLRCPDQALVRSLAGRVGPLATTSANRHGHQTPTTAAEVEAELSGAVDLVVDGGRCEGAPSTVLDCTGETWRVLRAGAIGLAEVEAAGRA